MSHVGANVSRCDHAAPQMVSQYLARMLRTNEVQVERFDVSKDRCE